MWEGPVCPDWWQHVRPAFQENDPVFMRETEESAGKKRTENRLTIWWAWLAVGQLEWLGFFQHVTRDDQPLDLRGAFTDFA